MTAIVNRGTLLSEVAVKMNRTDLTVHFPGFVQRAEEEINRSLKHAGSLYRAANFAITGEWTTLPADFQEMVAVEIGSAGERRTLQMDAASYGLGMRGSITGTPLGFMIANGQIRLSPPSTATTCDLIYYRGLTTITQLHDKAATATNWLLDDHSGVYLYRTLMEASIHMRDSKRLEEYGAAYQGVYDSLLRQGRKMRQTSGMRVRIG